MSRSPSPPVPRWTISDLIDLEYLLEQEGKQTGTDFFAAHVEPWIDPAKIDHPDSKTLRAALWLWLQTKRRQLADANLPGRAFAGAQTLATLLLTTALFINALGVVFGLLRYDGRTYNVLVFLSLTLGLSWLFLLAGLLGYLTWGRWRRSPFVSLAQNLAFQLTNRLIRKPLAQDAANWWRETSRTRSLFTLPALALTQKAAVSYCAGCLCALLCAVVFLSIRFGWETTASAAMSPTLHQAAQFLGQPWSWIRPEWVPSLAVIEQSRITWEQGVARLPPASLSSVWIPFLTLSLLVWGLCPRLILLGWVLLRQRSALRTYSFQDRQHREWWRRITDFPFEIRVPGPADGAFAVHWAGTTVAGEPLRTAVLRQLRLHLEAEADAGSGSLDDDAAAAIQVREFLRQDPTGRIVVVADSWSLAPKDLGDFLDRLRQAAGAAAGIDLFLVGLPESGKPLSEPPASEVAIWEDFAARRSDPSLFVRPFRAEAADPGS